MTMKIVSCLKKLQKSFFFLKKKNVWRSTESARCDDHEDCFLPKKVKKKVLKKRVEIDRISEMR